MCVHHMIEWHRVTNTSEKAFAEAKKFDEDEENRSKQIESFENFNCLDSLYQARKQLSKYRSVNDDLLNPKGFSRKN